MIAYFQQDGGYYAGSVLPRGAVEQTGLVWPVPDVAEDGAEGGPAVVQDLGVPAERSERNTYYLLKRTAYNSMNA